MENEMSDAIMAGIQRNITRGIDKLGLVPIKKDKINNTQLLADTGLSIIHVNRVGYGRSMTIAYKGSKTMIELATAITHPDDTFSRKAGTKQAVSAFTAGRTVRVPVDTVWQGRTGEFVKTLFAMV
jgi:hypothetical protein